MAAGDGGDFDRGLLDGTAVPVFVVAAAGDGGFRWEAVNVAFAAAAGRAASDLIGRPVEASLPDPAASTLAHHLERCIDRGETVVLDRPLRLPGGPADWRVTLAPARPAGPGGAARIVGTATDATVEDGLRRALAEKDRQHEHLYQAAPAMAWSLDADMRVLSVSDRWLEIMGYAREAVVGRSATRLMTPATRQYMSGCHEKLIARGSVSDMRADFLRADGSVIEVTLSATAEYDAEAGFVRSFGVWQDVTALNRAMRDLGERELGYRRVLESLTDAILVYSDHRIVFANPAAARLLGAGKPEELLGLEPERFAVPERIEILRAIMAETLAERRPTPLEPSLRRRLDGGVIEVEAIKTFIEWDGRPSVLSVTRDVSERRRAERRIEAALAESGRRAAELAEMAEALALARDGAEAANRAKSDFLATMSHELRTPLNGILGMTELLADTALDPSQQDLLAAVRQSGVALLDILNDVLDLAKVEAGEFRVEQRDFDLDALIAGVEGLWRPNFDGKAVRFTVDRAGMSRPVLHSDGARLRQILNNLISNAYKYTEAGSVALAVAQQVLADDRVETRFTVRDSGIGIPAGAQKRLFDPFVQGDESVARRFGGTGLGLPISKRLAEMLGGEIGFESVEDAGSTFWFTVRCAPGADRPLVDRRAVEAEARGRAASAPGRRRRVLVAEDHPINRKLVTAQLESAGHTVDVVGDGRSAVERVAAGGYDVVLMDVQMPEMDGLTATRLIRGLPGPAAATPIVALTANAMKGFEETCREAGMNDYVSKPVVFADLLAKIDALAQPGADPAGEGDAAALAELLAELRRDRA